MSSWEKTLGKRRLGRDDDVLHAAMPDKWRSIRVYVTMAVFAAAFSAVVVKLFLVHLWPAEYLNKEGKVHEGLVPVHVARGNIYDCNGILLATDDKIPALCADPKRVLEPERVALLLNVELGIDEDETLANLSKRTEDGNPRRFVYLRRWVTEVSDDELKQIADLAGEGVYVLYEPMRYYPQERVATPLLGFVNRVGDACEGIELEFDKWLRSIPGEHRARKDAKSNLLSSVTLEYRPPQGGDHVYLTIDTVIQRALEQAIEANMARCDAERGMGMIMDARTGAILALAYRPAFDPNHYEDFDKDLWKNRALRDVFEPGSVFKIVTASAALELGVVTPDQIIDCEWGRYNPYGHWIRDVHKMGEAPFAEVFAQSSNIGHVKVARDLGAANLEEWIHRFGFGVRCTLDLQPFEEPGIVHPRENWSRLTMGALPIGQEIAVTMPQLARAMAVIANGGYLIRPYILDRVVSRDGEVLCRGGGAAAPRVLSPETAATMRDLCHQVVLRGTGTMASIPEFRVGGKTGTAQIACKDRRGFEADRFTAIFAGFAPVRDPRLVGVIIIHEPMIKRHFGGYVCGPAFREVMREALIRLQVEPDPVQEEIDTEAGTEEDIDIVGPRVVLAKEEKARTLFLDSFDDVELVARERDGTEWVQGLPDFTGMTKEEAHQRLMELGLNWTPQGMGRVVAQQPAAGTPITQVDVCRLLFSNRQLGPEHDQTTAM